jgi:hypothetical protein
LNLNCLLKSGSEFLQGWGWFAVLDSHLAFGQLRSARSFNLASYSLVANSRAFTNPFAIEDELVPPNTAALIEHHLPGNRHSYGEIASGLRRFSTKHGLTGLNLPKELKSRAMHLDPDFDSLTYGDNGTRRGARIAKLGEDDLLVFYASLRSIVPPREMVYGLVGLFVVEDVTQAVAVPHERRHENAHTRWTHVSENDVVVRGKPEFSGRFDRCIPIGEWRATLTACVVILRMLGGPHCR